MLFPSETGWQLQSARVVADAIACRNGGHAPDTLAECAACAGATYVIRQEDAARERIGRELLRPVGNLPQPYDDSLAPVVAAAPSIEDRFSRLAQLRQQDLISESEYQAKRLRLLDEV